MIEETKEQPKDSSKIQLMSLLAFAHELGYSYFNNQFWGCRASGTECISFNKVVQLHNADWEYVSRTKALYAPYFHLDQGDRSPFCIDGYLLRKLLSAKIVHFVHLQADKHGRVKCQKQWVNFTSEDTYVLYQRLLK